MSDFGIYFDLDGVLADYSTGIERKGFKVDRSVKLDLNRSGTGHPLKREMYELIRGTDFYETLPIMPGAVAMFRAALALDPSPAILTAAPKFGAGEDDFHENAFWRGAAYHKRRWVEEVFLPQVHPTVVRGWGPGATREVTPSRYPISDLDFICVTSASKRKFVHHKHGAQQVLIDDRIDNVRAWAEAGGCGLLHVDPILTLKGLEELKTLEDRLTSGWVAHGTGKLWSETAVPCKRCGAEVDENCEGDLDTCPRFTKGDQHEPA